MSDGCAPDARKLVTGILESEAPSALCRTAFAVHGLFFQYLALPRGCREALQKTCLMAQARGYHICGKPYEAKGYMPIGSIFPGTGAMQEAFALPILEAAYNLSEDSQQAIGSIAKAALELAPHGPVAVCTYDTATGLPDLNASRFERADDRYVLAFKEGTGAMPVPLRRLLLSLEPTVMEPRTEYIDKFPAHLRADVREMTPLAVMATTGDGGCVSIGFGDLSVKKWPPSRMRHFQAIAQHLAAAWRLRSALTISEVSPAIAAELRIDGTPTSLSSDASAPVARDALRRAVLARERARTGRRSANAQELWPALVVGRWSLLDAFTASGTRYIVAYENPARSTALRALLPRERLVLEHALAGRSGKWIALELGLSEPTVARTLRAAVRRLGVADIAGLAGVRTALFEPLDGVNAGGELAMARLRPAVLFLASLSQSERDIVGCVLGGKRVAAIARDRGSSPRTVAHQISSVYQKLGVSSRRELLAQLA